MARTMQQGEYFGTVVRRRSVLGFSFTENAFPADYKIARHAHVLTHFTCVTSGYFQETYVDGPNLECTAGSMLVVPGGLIHEDVIGPTGASTLSVELRPKTLQHLNDSTSLFEEPRVVAGGSISHLIERLIHEYRASDDASLVSIAGISLELIAAADRMVQVGNPAPADWLSQFLEELHRNPLQEISLGNFAKRFGVHEASLARSFRRRHGCSIGEYVRWMRIERSKSMLVQTADSVGAIAGACGFYDQAHFSRAFKEHVGSSPQIYRKAWRASDT